MQKTRTNQTPDQTINKLPERLEVMQDYRHFFTRKWRDQKVDADLRRVNTTFLKWARAFQREAKAHGVPIYIVRQQNEQQAFEQRTPEAVQRYFMQRLGAAIQIEHATIPPGRMTEQNWRDLATLGIEVAKRQGVKVRWGGPSAPSDWQMVGLVYRPR